MKPTAEQLREHFAYDPATGALTWKKPRSPKTKMGAAVGWRDKKSGRVWVRLLGYRTVAAAFIWCMVKGRWPAHEVDHRDGDPANDRWSNLRAATHLQNMQNQRRPKNNKSGFKGVHWCSRRARWRASIHVRGKSIYLGAFAELSAAATAFAKAELKYRGEFRREEIGNQVATG